MAKITYPLCSAGASGSIGPGLTFSQRASGQQVRSQRAQKDRITLARTTQRAKFSVGLTMWNLLPDVEKDYWTTVEKYGFVEI